MAIHKKTIISLLETIAIYLELKGDNPFKISAYRKAANALEQSDKTLSEIEDFKKITGIGSGTAAVIEEFINTGRCETLEALKAEVPEGLIKLLKIPGLGGKKIAKLYKELGVDSIESLQSACEQGKVRELAGFGAKTEEKLITSIKEIGTRPDRLPIAMMLEVAVDIEQYIKSISSIQKFSRAGSLRRMRETIKDLDFIIATDNPSEVREHLLQIPKFKETIASGDTKVSVVLSYEYDISVDFRLVKLEEFATTLHHFTGSKDHNVRMRQLAKERGEKISEYGVEHSETGEVKTFNSEEEFFAHFGLTFIPPEMREDGREVDQHHEVPTLVSLHDIRGDLHMHSTWSDGAHSIEEMAIACMEKGYSFMALTDHSQYLKVANGLTPSRWREQRHEVARLNEKYAEKGFRILSGIELDILPDETLDFDDAILNEMDLVIASIHSGFSQSRDTIMRRLKRAIENYHVDIIAHPTGRLIGKRSGYDVDVDMLIELALETDTVLELNANPHRLDLSAEYVRKAQDAGVKITVNTDAHHLDMLDDMAIGVATARKGWLRKETVINTWDLDRLISFLNRNNTK
ncbi:DNA polymerase/3'-5' exonuclease PolX [Bacillus sp. HMF5848]|uniref:DNA polymerase/3'-5' exonuclease PolX n=1 Tax=Bacillus sp. HMF5848 TaxID=2495421 RepID=UPI000F7719F1|nr:DNA polymerase/3'-5' exonuclease PolX [Bacillus sp. HMF5848]RSK28091.1 DNA polymerase/3'-5' exonuclease PolX [Bacillus sp. HMF5848]